MPGLREEGTEPRVVLLRQVGRRVLGTVLVGGTWLSEPSGRGGQWGWGCLSVGRHPSWEPVPCVPWWRRRPSAPSVLQQRHRSASEIWTDHSLGRLPGPLSGMPPSWQ